MRIPENWKLEVKDDEIKLFDPEYLAFSYGPNNDIAFGPRGGFEERMWIGPKDHPLLPALFAARPEIEIVNLRQDPAKVYVCTECTPPSEWKSIPALQGHQGARHRAHTVQARPGGAKEKELDKE